MDDGTAGPCEERRRAWRAATEVAVTVREVGQHQVPAQLTSLSRFGCRLEGATINSAENQLWIRLPGLESQLATVRWSTFGCGGAEFQHPLHPAIANRFAGTPPEPGPAEALADCEAAPMTAADRPNSRREQILCGQAEQADGLLSRKAPRPGERTLSGLIRRHRARVAEHRHERRYPAPVDLRHLAVQGRATAVVDLSSSGIRLGRGLAGTIGDAVVLDFAGFAAVTATIVWTGKDATGLAMPANAIELTEAG